MVKTDNFILRYSNCWEDCDLLISQLASARSGKFCSIASGGENSLSLLTLNPELLVIVDVNPLQLYLTELKMVVIKTLEYEECISFLGYHSNNSRINIYNKIKSELSTDARNFWEEHKNEISNGIIYAGHTEGNMQFFAKYIRPLIHSNRKVNGLLEPKSLNEQVDYYSKQWNNQKWRMIFRIFFSRFVMRMMAPDPDFLNFYNGNIAKYLLDKTSREMSSLQSQSNHILHFILNGNFGNILPFCFRQENLNIIKERINNVKFYNGFAEEPAKIFGAFDAFNLSNIFEYTLTNEFTEIGEKLSKSGNKDAFYVYWNILISRKLSSIPNIGLINLLDTSLTSVPDKGWLYSACILDKKN